MIINTTENNEIELQLNEETSIISISEAKTISETLDNTIRQLDNCDNCIHSAKIMVNDNELDNKRYCDYFENIVDFPCPCGYSEPKTN